VIKKRPREHNEKQKNSSLWSGGSKTIPDITYKNPQAEDQGLKQELRTKEVTSKQNKSFHTHSKHELEQGPNHFTADGTNHGRPAHAPEKISEKWIWAEDWKPNMSCRENEDQGVQRSKAETTAQAANQIGEKIFAARGGKALGREPLAGSPCSRAGKSSKKWVCAGTSHKDALQNENGDDKQSQLEQIHETRTSAQIEEAQVN
jgi:hypothetical protein